MQHKEYALMEQEYIGSETFRRHEAYWMEKFSDEVPVLNLPLDYPRPAIQDFAGNNIHFVSGKEQTKALKNLAKNTGTSLFIVLLAAYYSFLYTYFLIHCCV